MPVRKLRRNRQYTCRSSSAATVVAHARRRPRSPSWLAPEKDVPHLNAASRWDQDCGNPKKCPQNNNSAATGLRTLLDWSQASTGHSRPICRIEPHSARTRLPKDYELCVVHVTTDDLRKQDFRVRQDLPLVPRRGCRDQKITALIVSTAHARYTNS